MTKKRSCEKCGWPIGEFGCGCVGVINTGVPPDGWIEAPKEKPQQVSDTLGNRVVRAIAINIVGVLQQQADGVEFADADEIDEAESLIETQLAPLAEAVDTLAAMHEVADDSSSDEYEALQGCQCSRCRQVRRAGVVLAKLKEIADGQE